MKLPIALAPNYDILQELIYVLIISKDASQACRSISFQLRAWIEEGRELPNDIRVWSCDTLRKIPAEQIPEVAADFNRKISGSFLVESGLVLKSLQQCFKQALVRYLAYKVNIFHIL